MAAVREVSMDRESTTPFMLRLFYRTAAFHRPDEFDVSSSARLPPHLTLHVWPDCTLTELSHHIAAASSSSSPRLLPDPAIGTRLVFRLIFPALRGVGGGPVGGVAEGGDGGRGGSAAKFMVKDLGSVVIGEGGKGLDVSDLDELDGSDDEVMANGDDAGGHYAHDRKESQASKNGSSQGQQQRPPLELGSDGSKTLSEARLVPGDYISCAILPPLEDGSVAPASSARSGRGVGTGESRAAVGLPPSGREGYRGGRGWDRSRHNDREDGYGRHGGGPGRGGFPGRDRGGGRGGGFGARRDGGGVPMGEWRRGETLPNMSAQDWKRGDDGPPSRGRGRGRW